MSIDKLLCEANRLYPGNQPRLECSYSLDGYLVLGEMRLIVGERVFRETYAHGGDRYDESIAFGLALAKLTGQLHAQNQMDAEEKARAI